MEKTNVMRLLDSQHLPYQAFTYPCKEALSGVEVARLLDKDEVCVFKTLVTVGASKRNYVFVIPVAEELSLKKAANAAKEKSIEMLKAKDLLPLTGYIHGGCSPIGMKKPFATFVDEQAELCETIFFSAGRIGFQIEMKPEDLYRAIPYQFADLTV